VYQAVTELVAKRSDFVIARLDTSKVHLAICVSARPKPSRARPVLTFDVSGDGIVISEGIAWWR